MSLVYKYYLNGTEYTPLNTGGFTIDYNREQESGSYQYVKSTGGTVNFDDLKSNGAFTYINQHGDCQKITLVIKEFCAEFPNGITIFDGYFTNRDCAFEPDLTIVKVTPRQDTLYQCLKDNFDRNFNFLEAPTVVSSTYAEDISEYEYAISASPIYSTLTRPMPFFGLPMQCPGPSSPIFAIALFVREVRTTYCQAGEPQAPAAGTGAPWSLLVNNCEGRSQATWYRIPQQLDTNVCAVPIGFAVTACTGFGCTLPPPPVTVLNEVWVLMDFVETTAPVGRLGFWIDENSIPKVLEEFDNGRLLTEVINYGLNQHCEDLDLQSNLLFDSVNPVTGNAPSTTFETQVHAISDIKDPTATEPASREDINLKDIFEGYIQGKLNAFWRVDEGTKRLIIEHYNDLNNQGVIDLTAIADGEYLRLKNSYEYDNSDIPKAEEFPSLDSSIDFTGVDINFDNDCATGKKSYITDKFYSEVESIRLDSDAYPIDGVVMITPDSLAPIGTLDASGNEIGTRAENGVITGDYLPNAPQGMAQLHDKFWKFYRPFNNGEVNFEDVVFSKLRPIKQLQSITLPMCALRCFFLFFPTSAFIGNVFTDGQLVSSSFSPATGFITLNLEYS